MNRFYQRQESLMPSAALNLLRVSVAGCGAVGAQFVRQLVSMGGVPEVYDPDVVSVENVGPQNWAEGEVGQAKVVALHQELKRKREGAYEPLVPHLSLFPLNAPETDLLVMCVDSIGARRGLYQAYKRASVRPHLIDARVAGEVIRVIAVKADDYDQYEQTLFADDEAFQAGCTTKMSLYSASVAAGLLCTQVAKLVRDQPLDFDVRLNLMAMEMAVVDTAAGV